MTKAEKILLIVVSSMLVLTGAGLIFFKLNNGRREPDSVRHEVEDDAYALSEIHGKLPENSQAENNLKMLFVGDMMLDRNVGNEIRKNGLWYIFDKLDETGFFDEVQIVGANLEGAVTDGGEHYNPEKIYDFAFHPEVVAGLKKYNFNFFNLANNHFDDQGKQGMDETRKNLETAGFYYTGCANGLVDECSARVVEVAGKKVGLVGLAAVGVNFDIKKAGELVEKTEHEADIVVVSIHWGEEYQTQFSPGQKVIAEKLIDVGADVIVGHHPHVAEGIEIYKKKPIFYSLGNFLFDQYFSRETQEGLAVKINFQADKMEIKLEPVFSNLSSLRLASEEEKKKFLDELAVISAGDEELKNQIREGEMEIGN